MSAHEEHMALAQATIAVLEAQNQRYRNTLKQISTMPIGCVACQAAVNVSRIALRLASGTEISVTFDPSALEDDNGR